MRGMHQAMREADDNYDGKLKSASGLVGTDGEKCMRQEKQELCSVEIYWKVMEKALKTGESNARMKRIVAAPTAGSCGVVRQFFSLEEENIFPKKNGGSPMAAGIGGVMHKQGVSRRGSRRLSG